MYATHFCMRLPDGTVERKPFDRYHFASAHGCQIPPRREQDERVAFAIERPRALEMLNGWNRHARFDPAPAVYWID